MLLPTMEDLARLSQQTSTPIHTFARDESIEQSQPHSMSDLLYSASIGFCANPAVCVGFAKQYVSVHGICAGSLSLRKLPRSMKPTSRRGWSLVPQSRPLSKVHNRCMLQTARGSLRTMMLVPSSAGTPRGLANIPDFCAILKSARTPARYATAQCVTNDEVLQPDHLCG